ncbi:MULTISPECIES: DUF4238 domain-containing protein [Bradyrhizobium]|uniref:DUF4238 domain-containing protein n=1 Tax=Bradyrhizobium TaxID=374 RepID=UPI0022273232|nr:DUF4238 domain-containing protein [Bradyrhizobium sp. Mp19]MCW2358842.1 hypothetical protein [Bradyrhizobium elkanii]MDI2055841.1 DUF4238 domain-containing protein [Bradyrhizobium sp. Mp19]
MSDEKKGTAARKHHYVPQFYLRGFTDEKGQLLVTDRPSEKTFRTDPKNVAAQRDFNAVSIEGVDPQAVEKGLAEFEGKVAPALERIKTATSLSAKADRELLMSLICGLAIRNPRQRATINDFVSEIAQAVAEMALATKERWDSQVAQMKADGAWDDSTNVTFEDMQKFIKARNYKIEVAKEFNIGVEIEQHERLLEHISARKWQIVKAKDGSGGFVTTDVPICLRWSDNMDHGMFGPGFGVPGTQVIFPLSSKLALMGSFEGQENTVEADVFTVGSMNSIIISNARRQVYSQDYNFSYMRPFPEEIGSGATLNQDATFLAAGKPKQGNILPLRSK